MPETPSSAQSPAGDPSRLSDLVGYVTEFGSAPGEPANFVVQSICRACQGTTFWMECSEEDGVARRTCTACHEMAFIGDSEDLWAEADVGDATCPCSKKIFEIVVGYCLDLNGEVDWMIVGAQCEACGHSGIYADWSIDYEPSKALLNQT